MKKKSDETTSPTSAKMTADSHFTNLLYMRTGNAMIEWLIITGMLEKHCKTHFLCCDDIEVDVL